MIPSAAPLALPGPGDAPARSPPLELTFLDADPDSGPLVAAGAEAIVLLGELLTGCSAGAGAGADVVLIGDGGDSWRLAITAVGREMGLGTSSKLLSDELSSLSPSRSANLEAMAAMLFLLSFMLAGGLRAVFTAVGGLEIC